MTRTAIISDIHGNLEALKAVLQDIERQGIDEILCLGDIVGYGPNPVECLDLVRTHCAVTLRGNHENAVLHEPTNFNSMARQSIEWTRRRLAEPWWKYRRHRKFLDGLPTEHLWNGYLLVHGSPRNPTDEYIEYRDVERRDYQKFSEIFALFETVCFVGHTHIAGVFLEGPRFVPGKECLRGAFRYQGVKMIVNVGSVGQPRDHDRRACYLTVEEPEGLFEYHRVDYDVTKTHLKIHSVSALDPKLGSRLHAGV